MSGLLTSDFEMLGSEQRTGWLLGFNHCLENYSIWRDGVQEIDCLQRNIEDIRHELRQELQELSKKEEE